MNNFNVNELFKYNPNAIKLFLKWVKTNEEFCEYDYEKLAISLELGSLEKTTELIYFHKGNILDWLEENNQIVLVDYDVLSKKYICRVYNLNNNPIIKTKSCSNLKTRNDAYIKGIQKAINNIKI